MGGAIYFQSHFNKNVLVYMKNNAFEANIANEGGGAIFFTRSTEVYMDECEFKSNKVGQSGGAIFSKDSDLNFLNCNFVYNQVGFSYVKNISTNTEINEVKKVFKLRHPVPIPKGGGAICFCTDYAKQEKLLYTSNTYFSYNNAYNCTNSEESEGDELLFSGNVKWQSFEDSMNFEINNYY